jgi:hypothetical protein
MALPFAIVVATRLVTFVIAWFATRIDPSKSMGDVLTFWDGGWYKYIAVNGYGELPIGGIVSHPFMTLAFFPITPLSARWLDALTGSGPAVAGVAISMVAGLAGAILLWRLVERRYGDDVATASLLLVLLSPHGFVLSMFYSESIALLLVVVTFWMLDQRRWELAGLAALAAGLARPNGFLLVVPCLVAAIIAIRAQRSWRPLVAPMLAPIGFIGWVAYVGFRTGEPLGYFEVQRVGWDAEIDGGWESTVGIWHLVSLQWETPDQVGNALFLVLLGGLGLWCCFRARLDPVWIAYSVALAVLTFANARQASSARFLLTGFSLFVGMAIVAGNRWRGTVIAASAALSGALFVAWSTTLIYTP